MSTQDAIDRAVKIATRSALLGTPVERIVWVPPTSASQDPSGAFAVELCGPLSAIERKGDPDLLAWLADRLQNCETIASHRIGADRSGWLEDAAYFKRAIAMLAAAPAPAEPVQEAMNLTVWKDGSYLSQKPFDDIEVRNSDPDWLCSIPLAQGVYAPPVEVERKDWREPGYNDTALVDRPQMQYENPSDEEAAAMYNWLRSHFKFANDSMQEIWFDPVIEKPDGFWELDKAVRHCMKPSKED